ncbi:peptidylprolyl isomerase [Patiriisocius marinus]|uniref:peptidylprolyl isomerase n=1 Tax=Patiriisocius marinus TaxID=1397112 RepID=A0A5J4IZC2_9FLAO|nr:peptidylprolyl isomerase [Patiriisocius marinus]GER58988.1 peptidylprolyl isomerase [Patiriisocius marinus]
MKKLSILLLLTIAFASCQNKYPDLENGVYAEVVTTKGTFVAKLFNDATPLTVSNFVSLAEGTNGMVDEKYKGKRFYDSIIFHRVIKDFMIQGGDPLGTGSGNPGYKFPDEFVDSLKHDKKGMLSMANSGPATNGSQFFVTLKETPWLNGKHTVFGEVVKGMEVVDAIGATETSKPGDRPVETIMIETINIINKGGQKVPYFTEAMEKIETEKKVKQERIAKVGSDNLKALNALKKDAEKLDSGIMIHWDKRSKGQKPAEGSRIYMNYAGYYAKDGTMFDTNRLDVAERFEAVNEARKAANQYIPSVSDYGKDARLIPGFREALLQMSVGDKITAFIPSHLGYGERGNGSIGPNEDLIFELELTGIVGQQ